MEIFGIYLKIYCFPSKLSGSSEISVIDVLKMLSACEMLLCIKAACEVNK